MWSAKISHDLISESSYVIAHIAQAQAQALKRTLSTPTAMSDTCKQDLGAQTTDIYVRAHRKPLLTSITSDIGALEKYLERQNSEVTPSVLSEL